MKAILMALLCLAFAAPGWGQSSDSGPATKDDVILYLRTMHSHDMAQRVMEVQSKAMQQLLRNQLSKDGALPADFDTRMKKMMDDLVKNMPLDEMTEAMIPAYQAHFTHGDIAAMNAFYSSAVGQKVLEELPTVMQEGMQEMMPLLTTYLNDWKQRMQKEFSSGNGKKSVIEN